MEFQRGTWYGHEGSRMNKVLLLPIPRKSSRQGKVRLGIFQGKSEQNKEKKKMLKI